MATIYGLASVVLKVLKLVINLIVLILYRVGNNGDFLGVGGTWNLNEEKSPDSEIITSGVLVGYMIYTTISFSNFCFSPEGRKQTFTDICMNIIAVFLWFAVGSTALHYWIQYYDESFEVMMPTEKQFGLAVGSLCIINGAIYLGDTVISIMEFIAEKRR